LLPGRKKNIINHSVVFTYAKVYNNMMVYLRPPMVYCSPKVQNIWQDAHLSCTLIDEKTGRYMESVKW